MATLKDIFQQVSMMNPTVNYMSSIGEYVDSNAQQLADYVIRETMGYLPEDSLAMKIIRSTRGRFTEKQLLVVAYELQKNAEYCAQLDKTNAEIAAKEDAKREASRQKLANNKANSQSVLDYVKSQGRLLGDYYKFVKANKKFAREFFSKKFTMESANAFINA
jgi:hypothetical protein